MKSVFLYGSEGLTKSPRGIDHRHMNCGAGEVLGYRGENTVPVNQ